MSNSTSSTVVAWLRLMLAAAACLTDSTPGSPACATALGGATAPKLELGPVLDFAGQQLRQTLKDFPAGSELFPGRETQPDGRWPAVEDTNWVSGAPPRLPAGVPACRCAAALLPPCVSHQGCASSMHPDAACQSVVTQSTSMRPALPPTAGFHTGCLWQMHALTGEAAWADAAASLLPSLESVQNYTGVGAAGPPLPLLIMMLNSYLLFSCCWQVL